MKTTLFLVSLFFAGTLQTFAREGISQDFAFYMEKSEVEISVSKDGSYDMLMSYRFRVKRDEAKNFFGPYKTSFDPSQEEINIEEAYVENSGKKISVNRSNIQISNASARRDGLVTESEVAIPFSQVKPDSLVVLKMRSKLKAGPFADYFNFHSSFGDLIPEFEGTVKVKSPKELFFTANNPFKVLNVSKTKDKDGNYLLEARLLHPHSHIAVNEVGKIKRTETTSIMISNLDSWDKFRQIIIEKFVNTQLSDPLPPALTDVISKIPKNASLETKVNAALVYITSNYDYLGDWRGEGKVIPKKIDKIVADHFGDCKDFSTLLIKLLRGMNIKADYALVERSYTPSDFSEDNVPMMQFFNHMIVRVEHEGKVFWIDPTNRYSVGLNVRADISGRKSLVLGKTQNAIEKIPEIDFSKQVMTIAKLYQFESENSATVDVIFKQQGEEARINLDSLKNKSSIEFQEALRPLLTGQEKSAILAFNIQGKKEHEYYDINVKAKYRGNELTEKEKGSKKPRIALPHQLLLASFLYLTPDNIGEVDVRLIPRIENITFYKNLFLSGAYPQTCLMENDWVKASRSFDLKDNGIIVKDLISFKVPKITKQIYSNRSFGVEVRRMYRCFNDQTIEVSFNSKKHTDILTSFEGSISSLNLTERMEKRIKKAYDILNTMGKEDENGFIIEDARILLEKNLSEKSNDPETLRAMAAYYSSNGFIVGNEFVVSDMMHALNLINKTIALDPKNFKAVLDKVSYLNHSGKKEESKKLLMESLPSFDIAKADYRTLQKLMNIFVSLRDIENTSKYFDLALKAAPTKEDKADLLADRASYHSSTGDNKLCIEYYEKSLELDSSIAWNFGNVANCYNSTSQFDKAIDRAKKAISIMNYGVAHDVLATAYLGKSELAFNARKFKESEENLQLALMESPRADIYLNLLKLYLEQEKYEQAAEAAKNAILAADEDHPKEWVEDTLLHLKTYYEHKITMNHKAAKEREDSMKQRRPASIGKREEGK